MLFNGLCGSDLGPFPYRWVTHAQYEVQLHRGLVFQDLEIETNKASLNDWYSCLYVQGLQPTNHLGNHGSSGRPASNECNSTARSLGDCRRCSNVSELDKLSSREQTSCGASMIRPSCCALIT